MSNYIEELLQLLGAFDKVLDIAVSSSAKADGSITATDPYQGLYINENDVESALNSEPETSLYSDFDTSGLELLFAFISNLDICLELIAKFNLSLFEIAIIIIALASEIDLKYEKIFAYLQDDVTRKRPSIDLTLNLLCTSVQEKLNRRVNFAPAAPLIRLGILQLIPDPQQIQPPLLAHYLKLDEHIIRLLLGSKELDSRLRQFSQLLEPKTSLEQLPLNIATKQTLEALIKEYNKSQTPLQLYFYGLHGVGKKRTAEAIANYLSVSLLTFDLSLALQQKIDFDTTLQLLFREAKWHKAIVYLTGLDPLLHRDQYHVYLQLLAALNSHKGIIILAGKQVWNLDNTITIEFTIPEFAQRRAYWSDSLAKIGITLEAENIDILSERFQLTPEQIDVAITTATNQIRKNQHQTNPQPNIQDLFAASRAQSWCDLTSLARKIPPKHIWNDIILPNNPLMQLREICNQVKHRRLVYEHWGFENKLSLGKGINVLFSGSPGTGKTMAAEIIANELELELYKIDLSQIVSKYIGETEKNLERVFAAAENANAILLFDEADAIFGKRSEVKDAHDRYANLEVAYLLQKMEEYEGITILTTNLSQNLDAAFTRRIRFIIEFPFPETPYRLQIWENIFPKQTPLSKDVDLKLMAQKFQLAGGEIRNIAVAAAFMAVEDGECITMKHLLQATKREFMKMGRLLHEEDFNN